MKSAMVAAAAQMENANLGSHVACETRTPGYPTTGGSFGVARREVAATEEEPGASALPFGGALVDPCLDKQGVSNELMADWAAKEEALLSGCLSVDAGSTDGALPPDARDLALRYMQHLAQLMQLPETSLFDAAGLLDMYYLRAEGTVLVDTLPATCVATMKLLKKVDSALISMKGCNLAAHGAQLSQMLCACGYEVAEPGEHQVAAQELAILEALGWRVIVPTVKSWTSMFCSRFNVLTHGFFLPSLQPIWQSSIAFGTALVMWRAASPSLPPRRMAAGIIGLSFVVARLLPVEALKPAQFSDESWQQCFASVSPEGVIPSCVLEPVHAHCVWETLQQSTGLTAAQLQGAAAHAVAVLAELVADTRNAPQLPEEGQVHD